LCRQLHNAAAAAVAARPQPTPHRQRQQQQQQRHGQEGSRLCSISTLVYIQTNAVKPISF
jgi:hypothetical protein